MDGVASAVNILGVNALRATGFLLVALLLAVFLRRSAAAARHQVWAGVIAGLLLLPAAGLLAPPMELAWLTAPRPVPLGPFGYRMVPSPEPAPWLPPVGVPVAPPLPALSVPQERRHWEGAPVLTGAPRWVPTMVGGLWLLGTALALVRFARRRRQAGRLLDGTRPADPTVWPLAAGLEVREGAVELPMTLGALRPVILVPAREGREWTPAWRAAIIEHEAAHVRRRDPLWQALAELACALYWFHPLIWLAARQLRTERELAADDEVLRGSTRPSEYADLLITLGALPASPPQTGAVLPLLTPAGLKTRLLGIVEEGRPRTFSLAGRGALAALGCLLFVPTASAVLVTRPTAGLYQGAVLACARDERSHQPIAGAEVDVWDGMELAQRVTTDGKGCVRWFRESSHSGQLVVYVRRGGLAGRKAIWPGAYGTDLPVTIDVRPALSVSGTIRDDAGQPLLGALVRVVWAQRWARGPGPDAFVLSGADGRFHYPGLLYGNYRLYFEGPKGGVATQLVDLSDEDATGIEVEIPKAWPVTGYLRDEYYYPVAGARVEDVPFYGEKHGLRGRHIEWDVSDADGAFRVVFIGRVLRATGRDKAGRLVSAVFPDFDRRPSPVQPGAWDPGRPADHRTIVLRPAGIIHGVARLPGGQPAAGAFVQGLVHHEGRPAVVRGDLSVRGNADGEGRFTLGPLALGEVELRAMIGPRSDPPYRIRSARQKVVVTGESDPAIELLLDWQLERAP